MSAFFTFSGVFLTGFVSLDSVLASVVVLWLGACCGVDGGVLPESVLSFSHRIFLVGLRW